MSAQDEAPSFTAVEVPHDPQLAMPETATDVPEIACTECGKDIAYLYKGRGRKPTKCEEHKAGSATRLNGAASRGSSGDIRTAVNALEQGYQLAVMGLMLAGAKDAAAALTQSIPKLNADNAKYLAGDKDLVKAINKVGKTSSRAGFFIAQVSVLGPVGFMAYQEIRARKDDVAE